MLCPQRTLQVPGVDSDEESKSHRITPGMAATPASSVQESSLESEDGDSRERCVGRQGVGGGRAWGQGTGQAGTVGVWGTPLCGQHHHT